MQMVSEVMTRDVRFVAPQESLQHAAQMMDELDVGALPVCDGNALVGMITDRDITVRGIAEGRSPQDCHVADIMSSDVRWCFEDQPLDEVMIQMADSQIRRVPVVTHDERHTLVGIVSLGDVATHASGRQQRQDVDQVMEMISTPSEHARMQSPNRAPPSDRNSASVGTSSGSGSGSGDAMDAQSGSGPLGADSPAVGTRSIEGGGDTGSGDTTGLGVANAGESGIGAAGAAGNADNRNDNGKNPAASKGVGGPDLTGGGLPPA